MALLEKTPGLFRDTDADKRASITHAGMAHFAGTGPATMTCCQCKHWGVAYERSRTKVCLQARRMGVKCGAAIPPEALACKYFEPAKP